MYHVFVGPSQENFLYQISKVQMPQKIVHEELALQWVVSSGSARELATTNSWFVYSILTYIVWLKSIQIETLTKLFWTQLKQ